MRRRTFLRSTIAAAVATSIPGRRSLAALHWPVAQLPPDVDPITGDGLGYEPGKVWIEGVEEEWATWTITRKR